MYWEPVEYAFDTRQSQMRPKPLNAAEDRLPSLTTKVSLIRQEK